MNFNFIRILIAIKIFCIWSAETPRRWLMNHQTVGSLAWNYYELYSDLRIRRKRIHNPAIVYFQSGGDNIQKHFKMLHVGNDTMGSWTTYYSSDLDKILIFFMGARTFTDQFQLLKSGVKQHTAVSMRRYWFHRGIYEKAVSQKTDFNTKTFNILKEHRDATILVYGYSAGGDVGKIQMLLFDDFLLQEHPEFETNYRQNYQIVSVASPPYALPDSDNYPDYFQIINFYNNRDNVPNLSIPGRNMAKFGVVKGERVGSPLRTDGFQLATGKDSWFVGGGHSAALYPDIILEWKVLRDLEMAYYPKGRSKKPFSWIDGGWTPGNIYYNTVLLYNQDAIQELLNAMNDARGVCPAAVEANLFALPMCPIN